MIKTTRLRHANRFRQIIHALVRNGFGFFVQKIGLMEEVKGPRKWWSKENKHVRTSEERIRHLLEELGPTFVKLGQIASTRNDVFPPRLIAELEKLQDHVSPFSYEEVEDVFYAEMEQSIDEYFASFDKEALASASIGQVHKAVTHDGREVAVKVQRPGIERTIEVDLDILYDLAHLAERQIDGASRYRLTKLVKEFTKMIRRELDYTIEGRNTDRIRQQTADNPNVYIPEIDWTCTTKKVLTMELIDGKNINQIDTSTMTKDRTEHIAETIAQTLTRQIFVDGFYHADPHPGNVFILEDDSIAFLDFGMIGRLTPELRNHLATFVMGIVKQDTDDIVKAVSRIGKVPMDIDRESMRKDIDEFQDLYFSVPLHEIEFGRVVNDLLGLVGSYNIEIPQDVTLVAKSLVTAESLISDLDPDISIIEVVKPLGNELKREHFSAQYLKRKIKTYSMEYVDIFSELPDTLKKAANVIDRGRLRHDVRMPEAEMISNRFARIGNQLTLSILLLAISLILGALILGITLGDPEAAGWLRLPVLEGAFVLFALLFGWLMISVLRTRKK
ncbi:ABC1 kinase family protein [Salisediminibacterium halotolerans]|uniref:Ubiquinone biosynthesis protein n=1 Tax=Salisediminibacterium halotolerans TaxID=517425 RepID=A0A1H9TUT6_9BACI|nr:AarF/ABC1/UbiB kinase family protein [Salisediminibacterium haloalkalitolerans]SES00936.1 ubiquinone biosynthesis protein [Salisediminibacterium haloalkalitolerans]